MDGERYAAIGFVFFIILGIACIGKSCSDKKAAERAERAEELRRQKAYEDYCYPPNLYQMTPEEYRAYYKKRRKDVQYPGIRQRPGEDLWDYERRAEREVNILLGHPEWNEPGYVSPALQKLDQTWNNAQRTEDETDAMNRLSDIYDGYMDYDDYDANMESTGNPEEDDIISYESFVEGDAGEWERLGEGEWE